MPPPSSLWFFFFFWLGLVASYWVCFVSVFGEFLCGGAGGGGWGGETTYWGQRKSRVTVKDGGVLEINAHSRWSFEGIT